MCTDSRSLYSMLIYLYFFNDTPLSLLITLVHPLLPFFFFNDPAPTEISPLPLHDALPISQAAASTLQPPARAPADSLPACAEPGHLGHEAKNSLMPPAMAASLAAALLVACGGGGGDTAPGTGNGGNEIGRAHV